MDLIQKANNLGFVIKNKEYHLWEIQKWLRELPTPIIITPITDFITWEVQIQHADKDLITLSKNNDNEWFISYEEALEEGLKQALALI